MRDLLLPATDGGALAQVVIALVVFGIAVRTVWGRSELRILVIGLAILTLALFGVRAVH